MTKTVKKRLQAVVALLVTLMIMVGIMPSEALDGILKGTTVKAASHAIYFNMDSLNATKLKNTGSCSTNDKLGSTYPGLSGWSNDGTSMYVRINGTGSWNSMSRLQSPKNHIMAYTASEETITKLEFSPYSTGTYGSGQQITYSKRTWTGTFVDGQGTVFELKSNWETNVDIYVSTYADNDLAVTAKSDKSILVGVKYYNYFYDEQIAYEMAGGTADPTSLTVTNGQAKNPYTLFNRAVMASDYGGNNNYGRTRDISTNYPVMYLGEFWLGGNAENSANNGYSTSPNDVSAGKYPRSVNINDGGDTITVSNHVNNNDTTIYNDTLTNFKWGANLASRGSGAAQKYYHMLAQGLVDNTLSMDPTSPNYLVPTINGQRIPYFDEKFLSASTNSDLANITNNKDVGKVYTSIFPFYRKDVTFKAPDDSTDGINTTAWNDKWIRTPSSGANEWGTSLTTNNANYASQYYTFNSMTDTVSIKTGGGASSDTGEGVKGYGSTYSNFNLNQAVAHIPGLGEKPNVFTSQVLTNLKGKYTQQNYDYAVAAGLTGDALPPIINDETAASTLDTYSVANVARSINIYKNGAVDSDDVALLTIAGYYDNTATDGVGHVKDVDCQNGYFPFNSSSDGLSSLQYGFGTRLDIRFNINKNGKVESTDGQGHYVDEIFRFTGDDDVWVFIDGQLVLDMGGGHKNGIGEINFAKKQAAVLYAGDASSGSAWAADVPSGTANNGVTITTPTILTTIRNEADGSSTGISEDHTLTMFYMERGKLNSNMSVMFNFRAPDIRDITDPDADFPATPSAYPAPNPVTTSKLKIREITNIENVNPGLVTPTKMVAENDAFRYTMITNAQRSIAWPPSGILTPTRDTYERDPGLGNDYKTTLSSNTYPSGEQTTNGGIYDTGTLSGDALILDFNGSGKTGKKYYAVWAWKDSGNGAVYKGREIAENVYAFPVPSDSNTCIMCSSDNAFGNDGSTSFPNGTKIFGDDVKPSYSVNYVYSVSSAGALTSKGDAVRASDWGTGTASYANFANVNYIWNSAFTTKTQDVSDYVGTLTNTTTGSEDRLGTFTLLYGTSDEESSALFKNQFYYDNGSTQVGSTLKVLQTLAARNTNIPNVNDYDDNSSRNVSKYYTTSVSTVKRNGGEATVNAPTVTQLSNGLTVDSPDMDIIISNYVNVGSVEIEKVLKYQTSGDTPEYNDVFNFTVAMTEVFGGNVSVSDYTAVTYKLYTKDSTGNYDETYEVKFLEAGGILKLKGNQKALIEGIPEDTHVVVTENHTSSLKTTTSAWNDYYNKENGNTNHKPTMSAAYVPANPSSYWKRGNTTSGTDMNGVVSMEDVANVIITGANSISQSHVWGLSVTNTEADPTADTHALDLVIQKIWQDADTAKLTELGITSVKFEIQQMIATTTPTSEQLKGETGWTDYTGWTGVSGDDASNGIIVLTASNSTVTNNPLTWSRTIQAVDGDGQGGTYYYRIREYGKNDAVFILSDGGYYSQNFQAVYGAGTSASPVTNIGSGDVGSTPGTSPATNNAYKTVVVGGTDPDYTYTLTLSIANKYSDVTVGEGQPLPKTGARGVYAIVTFGAFAITIAGVALLIYRKKLQTVNIYAVKGSGKPKE